MPNLNLKNCLYFNGTSTNGSIPDNDAYSYVTNSGLTISVWIKPETTTMTDTEGTGYVEYFNKTGNSKNEWLFRMYQDGNSENRFNRLSFYHFTSTGGLGAGASFQDVVKPNEWIHIIGRMDTQYISIFKNGIFRSKADWTATGSIPITPSNTSSNIRIGAGGDNSDSLSSYFQGNMDDIRIWGRALTDNEIHDISNGIDITTSLVGFWKMDESSGTTLTDSSSTANNGSITSGSWNTSLKEIKNPVYRSVIQKYANNITNARPDRFLVTGNQYSLTFNGSTQYASISDGSQTGLDFDTHDFLIGGWYKLADNAALQMLMCKYSGASFANNASGLGWELMYRGDQATKGFNFRLNDGQATGVALTTTLSNVNLANGQWHHIACSADRDDLGSIFIDGVLLGTGSISSRTGSVSSSGSLVIGRRGDLSSNNHVLGSVNECFAYDFGNSGIPDPAKLQSILEDIYYRNMFESSNLVSRWSLNNSTEDIMSGNVLTLTGSPSYLNNSRTPSRTML